jgi:hypothetical protein
MGTLRFTIGFLIAPLALPLIEVPPWQWHGVRDLPGFVLSVVLAYFGAFLFGIPACLLLRRLKRGAFWLAPAAGFIAAGLTASLGGSITIWLLGIGPELPWQQRVLWPYGPAGAFIGALLCVMAPFDRAENHGNTVVLARTALAFLVAPLVVPIFVAIENREAMSQPFWRAMIPLLSISVAYAGTLAFGIPAFLFLRARRWTAFWIAPVFGFLGGALAWWIFWSIPWTTGTLRVEPVWNLSSLREVLWPYGPLGALVGTLLWLIARPDRAESRDQQHQPISPNA